MSRGNAQKLQVGYTFIEILSVAAVIAVLVLIAVPVYRGYITNTRTVDAVNALEALRLEIRAPAETRVGLQQCNDALVLAENLTSDYLSFHIGRAPNDLSDPGGAAGYGATMEVMATIDKQGGDGVAVAKRFYEELQTKAPEDLIPGIVTDSAVAFGVRLSEPGQPFCDPAGAMTASSGRQTGSSGSVNRPPVVGNTVDFGRTQEDTPIAISSGAILSASWDPDGDALTIVRVGASAGSITGDATKGYEYTPTADFFGDDVKIDFEVSDGSSTVKGAGFIDVISVLDPPNVSLTLSAAQQILDTGTDGRAVVDRLNTGGDMDEMTLEFSVVGRQGGSATASTGPVIFNYGTNSNNNVISAWRPSNFTVAIHGKDYATGINIADGNNHRVTVSWDSTTGTLQVFDNGKPVKSFSDVGKGQMVPGDGHLVIGQKMNNPGSRGGWNAGEHYSGQVFGSTFSNHRYTEQEIAGAPIYAQGQGIIADLRSQGGSMQDLTGNHSVDMQGNYRTSTVDVDTALALIPPGSEVKITVNATPHLSDGQITSLALTGLGSLSLTDGTNSGRGSVNITNWDTSQLRINLPAGFSGNQDLTLIAVAGDGSDTAMSSITRTLRMTR